MEILVFVLITLLWGVAVKQLSYALFSGSLFEPLRAFIRRGMDDELPGAKMLNELFTCQLCMTMQVSFWVVTLPIIAGGDRLVWVARLFEGTLVASDYPLFILLAFVYGMAVSGLALVLWHLLEYPARRYENLAYELELARQTIADLQGTSTAAEEGVMPSQAEFREGMNYVNKQCRGIGCGYTRRDCRTRHVSIWLNRWSSDRPERRNVVPVLRQRLAELLPTYFRRYSDSDRRIENEEAFKRLYQEVTAKSAETD